MKMICTTIAVALLALIFGATAARAQTDSIAPGQQMINFSDTAFALQEVTVKSSLPKTRVKGDALRTNVTGTILEKAGSARQLDLFTETKPLESSKLYAAIDALNARYGKGTLVSASQGLATVEPSWKMRREHLSRRATTNWSELMTVR